MSLARTHLNGTTRIWRSMLLALALASGLTAHGALKNRVLEREANVMVEVTFTAARQYSDPFNQVTLDVIFTDPGGREFRVPAFWAGGNLWKARYGSPVVGTHRFRSESSQRDDK